MNVSLEPIEGKTFRECYVVIDNRSFVNCQFEGVFFLYAGGPWAFDANCRFGPCAVAYQGAARLTKDLAEYLTKILGPARTLESPEGGPADKGGGTPLQ